MKRTRPSLGAMLAALAAMAPRRLWLGGMALACLTVLMGMALLGLSGWFIAATGLAGLVPATALVFDVFMPSAGIRLLALGRTAARYGERLVTHDATLAVLAALRERLFRSWAPAGAASQLRLRPARWLQRLTGDVDALDSLYLRLAVPLVSACGAALLAAVVLGAMHWQLGLLLGLWLLLVGTAIAAVPGLFALEIDPQAAAQAYRDRIVGPVRGVLPETVVKGIEEQLSGACTTEIAAFDEFTALLTDAALTADYAHIIFDTAPTGHTIRLLQLPGAWSGFLEAGKGDASCLGPLAGLEKQRSQYKAAVAALADPLRTRLVLVARAQSATLREVARTHAELAAIGLSQQYLVINGVLPVGQAEQDELAAAILRREQAALAAIPEELKALPRDLVALKSFNLVGLEALRQLLVPTADAENPAPIELPARLAAFAWPLYSSSSRWKIRPI